MTFEIGQVLAGLIGAALTALISYFTVSRKAKTDETSIALDSWKELLAPMTNQLRLANIEIDNLTVKLGEARDQIDALRNEMRERDEQHKTEVEGLVSQIRKLRLEVEKYKK